MHIQRSEMDVITSSNGLITGTREAIQLDTYPLNQNRSM